MHFIHDPYLPGETIAAIATPPGEGGIGIIRISGKRALDVAARVFSGPVKSYPSHTAHFGQVFSNTGDPIDEALLLVMLGKRSYTGENTVEIHCHGGSLITRRVLEAILQAGARSARPGEFTFRAFLNGKLDLAQAEAVQELICAKNEHALHAAKNQLSGALSHKISSFQKELTDIAAILEAWVDFPEEGLEFASFEEVISHLENLCQQMQQLLTTFHDGKILHDGLSLCLIGSPNVGKSSLMNTLLQKERAIVSDIPGTTRDIIEDNIILNGLHLRITDTAGIRETTELVEKEGIKRSKKAMEDADLILLVFDIQKGLEKRDHALLNQVPQTKTIAVWNKKDLPHSTPPQISLPHVVSISAKCQMGLDLLHTKIDEIIWHKGPPSKEEVLITNVRHKETLASAISSCQSVVEGLKTKTSPEFLSFDIRQSLSSLGKIIGTDVAEDILSAIFSKFCIGK